MFQQSIVEGQLGLQFIIHALTGGKQPSIFDRGFVYSVLDMAFSVDWKGISDQGFAFIIVLVALINLARL